MLALSLIVGFSLLVPVGLFTTYYTFYPVCAAAEVLFALLAAYLCARASYFVCNIWVMLIPFHLIGWAYGGYADDSPYRVLIKMLEYAQIVACCVYSKPFMNLIKSYATRIYR